MSSMTGYPERREFIHDSPDRSEAPMEGTEGEPEIIDDGTSDVSMEFNKFHMNQGRNTRTMSALP